MAIIRVPGDEDWVSRIADIVYYHQERKQNWWWIDNETNFYYYPETEQIGGNYDYPIIYGPTNPTWITLNTTKSPTYQQTLYEHDVFPSRYTEGEIGPEVYMTFWIHSNKVGSENSPLILNAY